MRSVVMVLTWVSIAAIVLGLITRFCTPNNYLLGIGQRGYCMAAAVLLLLSINLSLIKR